VHGLAPRCTELFVERPFPHCTRRQPVASCRARRLSPLTVATEDLNAQAARIRRASRAAAAAAAAAGALGSYLLQDGTPGGATALQRGPVTQDGAALGSQRSCAGQFVSIRPAVHAAGADPGGGGSELQRLLMGSLLVQV
jgi:hypothetical protein